jgi:hypothetical protein
MSEDKIRFTKAQVTLLDKLRSLEGASLIVSDERTKRMVRTLKARGLVAIDKVCCFEVFLTERGLFVADEQHGLDSSGRFGPRYTFSKADLEHYDGCCKLQR